jgi:hypothetical protein
MSLPVYLEVGRTRTFAVVPDWPGWSRSGRTEAAALQSLIDYAPRYAHVLAHTPLEFQPPASVSDLRVVDRLPGNATTDFGAPDLALPGDTDPLDAAELTRMRILLDACWREFGRAMQAAQGKVLRTGPRGGGRSLERIIAHARESELVYLSRLGGKLQPGASDEELRRALLDTLVASVRGEIPAFGPRGGKRWTPRYFVRRVAWHALDHAWEIEDRIP